MKYIITESRLEETITNYLDELFDVDNINYTVPYEYNDDTGEEYDDDTCFRYYFWEYFDEGSEARELCPIVNVEFPYDERLNAYFGDKWVGPFKKWFYKNFDLPVKTVE
jgi:hypothetical protein